MTGNLDHHNESLAERLASLTRDQQRQILASLDPDVLASLMDTWDFLARPDQLAPKTEFNWLTWLLAGGRGSGKSRSVCEYAHDRIFDHMDFEESLPTKTIHRIGVGGRSAGDIREVIVEGESGLMAVADSRDITANYEPSKKRITWYDGASKTSNEVARATLLSAEEPDSARGPQFHTLIGDELAAWDHNLTDDLGNNLYTNMFMGLRLGSDPRAAFATTPKRIQIIRELVEAGRDPDNHGVVLSAMTTMDNAANLSPAFLTKIITQYEGTRMYEQEVLGLLLDDDESMLWTPQMIAGAHRIPAHELPPIAKGVIGVDPPGGLARDHCGIVAVGIFAKPLPGFHAKCAAVVADRSRKGSPDQWARTVVDLAYETGFHTIIAESNQGYEMVRSTISNADEEGLLRVELVNSRDAKEIRAEPVAQLYEQGRVGHLEATPQLDDELTMFIPGQKDSPDRMDALVHGITHLLPEINTRPASASSVADLTVDRSRAAMRNARNHRTGRR